MSTRRILFPGLTLPVDDYRAFVAALPGETEVLDTLVTPVTGAAARLRAGLVVPEEPYEVVGHSVGAFAALEWAAAHPLAVSRIVLLEPSDPWGTPVPVALGGGAGRALVAVVSLVARSGLVARVLGRRGRATLLGMYGVRHDPMPRSRIDELLGTRAGLVSAVRQVVAVPSQVERARMLLDGGFEIVTADVVVIVAEDGAAADTAAAATRLSERLGAGTVVVPGGHLCPMTHPETTAAAVSRD